MKIGIIIAFNDEMGSLSDHGEIKSMAGIRYTERFFGGNEAVIALSGQGKVNAASCTQLLISVFGCDHILNIGLSGNASSLPVGGAVIADKAMYHDMDMKIAAEDPPYLTAYAPDPAMADLADRILTENNLPHIRGTVATGDIFVEESSVKRDIIARTGCSCVEMEGAAIGHVATRNGVPFCLVKVISDNAEEGARDQFHETLSIKSYISISTAFISSFCEAL